MEEIKRLFEALEVLQVSFDRNPRHPHIKIKVQKVLDAYEDCKMFTCSKCLETHDDVHTCANCDITLCIDCDENEMPCGADDHTYCTPCENKLFTEEDY